MGGSLVFGKIDGEGENIQILNPANYKIFTPRINVTFFFVQKPLVIILGTMKHFWKQKEMLEVKISPIVRYFKILQYDIKCFNGK